VVYETADSIGGGARTSELTLPGFRHDVCSAIHPMAIGSPYLRTLDLTAHGLTWVHPDVPLAHPLDDGVALLERGLRSNSLGADAKPWERLMKPFVDGWDGLSSDALAPLGIPRHPLLMARLGLHGFMPATRLANSQFSGRGKPLFLGIAAHSFLSLEATPSAAVGIMLGAAGHAVGWPMPKGGAQAIPDALASLFLSLGGTIQTGVRIDHLDAVETSGPVLFEVAPKHLARIAGDALPSGYRRKLEAYRHAPGVFKVDWALSEPIPWRHADVARAATVHLGGGPEELVHSERCAVNGEHCDAPFVLVAQHTLFDPSRAPEGKHTAWAYCHVPNGSTRDMTDVIESQLERYAPGFRDVVLARHTRNCAEYEAYNANMVGGDTVGGVADLGQLFTRPTLRVNPYTTPNPRIFLCSASTPPGGGIHGMCGVYAAKAALNGRTSPS
jgi:phytoene dehydrogenase-like protein